MWLLLTAVRQVVQVQAAAHLSKALCCCSTRAQAAALLNWTNLVSALPVTQQTLTRRISSIWHFGHFYGSSETNSATQYQNDDGARMGLTPTAAGVDRM